MTRAMFITEDGARSVALGLAMLKGSTPEQALQKTRTYPVYRRGEIKGYEAWYAPAPGLTLPVTDNDVETYNSSIH